jgi:hypothetical protein
LLQVTRLCEAQRSPSRLARHHTHPKKLVAGLWKLRARHAPHRNRSRPFAVCRWNGRLGRQRNEPPIEYIKRRIRFDFPPGNNHRDRGRVGARILERGPKTEPKDLLPILFERSNATATLWTIEIVVVLGSLAASAGKMIGHWSMKLALTVGFLVMAGFNVVAFIEVTEQRQELVDFFRTLKSSVLATSSGRIRKTAEGRLSVCYLKDAQA